MVKDTASIKTSAMHHDHGIEPTQQAVDLQSALGAVLGSAVGDALGAPFEFGPPGAYRRRFPAPVIGGTGEMIGGGSFGWQPGEFTDDTAMAIVQAESLLTNHGFDGGDLFERFRVWAADSPDVGAQTRAVLDSGLLWDRAAAEHYRRAPHRSAGNGALMRSIPSAIWAASGSLDDSTRVAHALAAVTHADPAAGWGSAIFHALIYAAVCGLDPFTGLPAILAGLPASQSRYKTMLDPTWSPLDNNRTVELDRSGEPGNGSVWGCLAQAIWAVRRTDAFSAAVTAAIDLGGDTDTVAAVTGGLAGAIYGIQAIPSRWLTYLHGHITTPEGPRTYTNIDLQTLTDRIVGRTPPADTELEPPAGPTEIGPRLWAANLTGAEHVPSDWAIISLCRTGNRFHRHPLRREVFLIDKDSANPRLHDVVTDVVDTIDAFLAEGRDVLVHCHGGASRTACCEPGSCATRALMSPPRPPNCNEHGRRPPLGTTTTQYSYENGGAHR